MQLEREDIKVSQIADDMIVFAWMTLKILLKITYRRLTFSRKQMDTKLTNESQYHSYIQKTNGLKKDQRNNTLTIASKKSTLGYL